MRPDQENNQKNSGTINALDLAGQSNISQISKKLIPSAIEGLDLAVDTFKNALKTLEEADKIFSEREKKRAASNQIKNNEDQNQNNQQPNWAARVSGVREVNKKQIGG